MLHSSRAEKGLALIQDDWIDHETCEALLKIQMQTKESKWIELLASDDPYSGKLVNRLLSSSLSSQLRENMLSAQTLSSMLVPNRAAAAHRLLDQGSEMTLQVCIDLKSAPETPFPVPDEENRSKLEWLIRDGRGICESLVSRLLSLRAEDIRSSVLCLSSQWGREGLVRSSLSSGASVSSMDEVNLKTESFHSSSMRQPSRYFNVRMATPHFT
jgi:hypothetical protein